jgi:hypothetical protein
MIAHIVLFEPKPGVTDAERKQFLTALKLAVEGISEIRRAQIGRVSEIGVMPEQISGRSTYSYVAVLEFGNKEGLKTYLDHPLHVEVRRLFWQFCAATLIADVEMIDASSSDTEILV